MSRVELPFGKTSPNAQFLLHQQHEVGHGSLKENGSKYECDIGQSSSGGANPGRQVGLSTKDAPLHTDLSAASQVPQTFTPPLSELRNV